MRFRRASGTGPRQSAVQSLERRVDSAIDDPIAAFHYTPAGSNARVRNPLRVDAANWRVIAVGDRMRRDGREIARVHAHRDRLVDGELGECATHESPDMRRRCLQLSVEQLTTYR